MIFLYLSKNKRQPCLGWFVKSSFIDSEALINGTKVLVPIVSIGATKYLPHSLLSMVTLYLRQQWQSIMSRLKSQCCAYIQNMKYAKRGDF